MAGERFCGEGDFERQKVQVFDVNFYTVSIWSKMVPKSPSVKAIQKKVLVEEYQNSRADCRVVSFGPVLTQHLAFSCGLSQIRISVSELQYW